MVKGELYKNHRPFPKKRDIYYLEQLTLVISLQELETFQPSVITSDGVQYMTASQMAARLYAW